MSKLLVKDLAAEFGISADELQALLRSMDVPIRSHMSPLSDDQASRIRARWEREKRARQAAASAPSAPAASRRRRPSAAAAPVPEVVEVSATAADASAATGVRRRRRADLPPTEEPADEAIVAPAPPSPESLEPARATAVNPTADDSARVARATEPQPTSLHLSVGETPAPKRAPVDADPVAPAPLTPAAASEPSVAPSARPATASPAAQVAAAGTSAPASLPAPVPTPASAPATPTAPTTPHAPARPAAPPLRPAASASPSPASAGLPAGARPRPVTPGAPRPRPHTPGAPRPVASGTPTGGFGRRDDRRPGSGPGGPGGPAGPGGGATTATPGGSAAGTGPARRGKKGKRGSDQEAVEASINKTMSAMRGAPARRGGGIDRRGIREEAAAQRAAEVEREKRLIRVTEFVTVSELAQVLKVSATEIVAFAFKNLGLMITINQRLDFDQIELIAGEFGFQAVREDEYHADIEEELTDETPGDLVSRPPVVTIMGHVDHGKTSLLDYIRKATVVAGEAGGITQHIGAYHVTLPAGRQITFLDTPGHEAFTAMRARGAQVTDIVVLVVAADDAVMPQTIEAISHAKNAGVPLLVAINKIDLPQANPMKVKQDLLQHEVVLEDFGGTVLSQEISAKKGTGVPELLDQILLQAEILDLKANAGKRATGSVVEAQLDPGKGPVATVLVQSGTLRVGEDFICGMFSGRVRALLDERGKPVKEAGPAIPVQVLGLTGVPMAGDQLLVVEDASQAREIAQRRERLDREAKSRRQSRSSVSLEDFMSQSAAGEKRILRILIKADQGGPAEALADALQRLSTAEVEVQVVHRGVGAISEGDILLAKASGAIIIGFHVRPDNNARGAADREGVDIKLYRIIYDAVNDVRSALEGMLRPESREVIVGEAEVRQVFKVPRIGNIAGCGVRSGIISRAGRVRVIRDGVEVYEGNIASLRRVKEDVREVREGFECGIGIENFNDIKAGDVIECFRTEEVARTLDQPAGTA